ncbi:MAG: hypothetical protein HY683_02940 [Chloroflexi bacterium]|nr:hypothetical protein [Chloroflexota bacterium]
MEGAKASWLSVTSTYAVSRHYAIARPEVSNEAFGDLPLAIEFSAAVPGSSWHSGTPLGPIAFAATVGRKEELTPFAAPLRELGIAVEEEPQFLSGVVHNVRQATLSMIQALVADLERHPLLVKKVRLERVVFSEEGEEECELDVLHLYTSGSNRDASTLLARLSSSEAEILRALDTTDRLEFIQRFRIHISPA